MCDGRRRSLLKDFVDGLCFTTACRDNRAQPSSMLIKLGSRKDLGRPKLAPLDAYQRFKTFLSETGQ